MTVFLHRGQFYPLVLIGINGHFLKSGFMLTNSSNAETGGLEYYIETKLLTNEKQLYILHIGCSSVSYSHHSIEI